MSKKQPKAEEAVVEKKIETEKTSKGAEVISQSVVIESTSVKGDVVTYTVSGTVSIKTGSEKAQYVAKTVGTPLKFKLA